MGEFDHQRDRQRGGQSARDGGDLSDSATPGKQTLSPGAPAAQAAPVASSSRPPFDAAAEPIRGQLDRARQLLVRLTTARASSDHEKVEAVTGELRSCLESARDGIARAQPSPAIASLRTQLAETEHQAALFIENAGAGGAKTALPALARAVTTAERAAAALRNSKAAFTSAPPATVVGGLVAQTLAALETAQMAMQVQPPEPAEVIPLAERLDKALTLIGAVAKRNHLSLAGLALDRLFDAEDDIRVTYAGLTRAGRANAYYDANLSARDYDGSTPDEQGIEANLLTADKPANDPKESIRQLKTRDDVVHRIQNFGADIERALSAGLGRARTIIKEPDQAPPPSMVERLVDIAVKMLSSQATDLLGVLIGGAMNAGIQALGTHDVLPDVTTPIVNGFRKAAGDLAITAAGTVASKPKAPAGDDATANSKVSPSSRFLDDAQDAVNKAISNTAQNFQAEEDTLKRTPPKVLLAVLASLTGSVLSDLEREYTDLVVHQWLNLIHDAGMTGKDIRDGKANPHPSALDILDTQRLGQIEVFVRLTGDHQIELRNAQLVGVSGALLEHIRAERESIGALALYRRVMGETDGGDLLGDFTIDANGNLQADMASASRSWGALVKQPATEIGDADVRAGMEAVRQWLGTVPADKLHGAA